MLAQELPTGLQGLAPTAAGALRQPATDAVNRLLDAPRVQALFVNASSLAQSKLVNVLENDTGDGISTGDGTVTLDLGAVVQQLGTDLGLPASALARIPPETGVITVMRSDQLSAAQTAVKAVRVLSPRAARARARAVRARDLPGARRAPADAAQHRLGVSARRTDRARRAPGGGNVAVDALDPAGCEEAGRQAWLIGSAILGQIGWAVILYGGIALLGSMFAGPTGPR